MWRFRLTTIVGLCAITGCAESELGTGPAQTGASTTVLHAESAVVDDLARSVALALQDAGLRQRVLADLRASPFKEHKLEWGRYVRGTSGGILLAKMAKESGHSRGELLAMIDRLPPLEFYMPVAAHRRAWRGGTNLLVGASLDERYVRGYALNGDPVPLSVSSPPGTPTLALVHSETNFRTAPTESMSDGSFDDGMRATASMTDDCDAGGGGVFIPCDDGGSGGNVIWPSLLPLSSTASPGLYLRQMRIIDNKEPWVRGASEIEVHIRGTQNGYYYGVTTPVPGLGETWELHYYDGPYRMGFSCAGEDGRVTAVKRFDFNGENGDFRTQNVVIARATSTVNDFGRVERVYDNYGALKKSRLVPMNAPFEIVVLERDDGTECPDPAEQTWGQFQSRVEFGFSGQSWIPSSINIDNWKAFFGIENSNDTMLRTTFSTWTAFEQINTSSIYNTHGAVEIRMTNHNLTRTKVPPLQDPY